jgi:hypothetical protein
MITNPTGVTKKDKEVETLCFVALIQVLQLYELQIRVRSVHRNIHYYYYLSFKSAGCQ